MVAGLITSLLDNCKYYAKPEGQDPVNKIMGLAKYSIVTAPTVAIYDAVLYSHCTNTAQFMNCLGYWFVPMTGMAVAFSSVTYAMVKLRKKDDKLNYIAGACASGGVLHAWSKNVLISGWGTFFFCLYAVLKHDLEKNKDKYDFKNIFLFEEAPRRSLFTWRTDPYRDYTPDSSARYPFDRKSAYEHFNQYH